MSDTRYSLPKQDRKIGGKIYHYLIWSRLKSGAEGDAERWRKRGKSSRVVKVLHGYAFYLR